MSSATKIRAIAGNDDLSLTERHARIKKLDPMAAVMFARIHHAPLAKESREADDAAEEHEIREGLKLLKKLPDFPALDRYEELQTSDPVAASLYHRAHSMQIITERDQRDQALAELDPDPEAA